MATTWEKDYLMVSSKYVFIIELETFFLRGRVRSIITCLVLHERLTTGESSSSVWFSPHEAMSNSS